MKNNIRASLVIVTLIIAIAVFDISLYSSSEQSQAPTHGPMIPVASVPVKPAHPTSSKPTTGIVSQDTTVIVIHDSGSTNAAGFDLTINPDGSATFVLSKSRNNPETIKHIPAATFDYSALQHVILFVPTFAFQTQCLKSASFGTTETVSYDNRTSGDITCVPSGQPYQDLVAAVNGDVTRAQAF